MRAMEHLDRMPTKNKPKRSDYNHNEAQTDGVTVWLSPEDAATLRGFVAGDACIDCAVTVIEEMLTAGAQMGARS